MTQIVLMKKIYVGVDNIIRQMDDGLQVQMIFKMYVIEYEYEYYSGIFGYIPPLQDRKVQTNKKS